MSIFINDKVKLQEKINKLDEKIQDIQKDLQYCMSYKNKLVVEMEILIMNDQNKKLKVLSIQTPPQASSSSNLKDISSTHTSISTQASSSTIKHNLSTQTSTHASTSSIKDISNLITPPPKRIKKNVLV